MQTKRRLQSSQAWRIYQDIQRVVQSGRANVWDEIEQRPLDDLTTFNAVRELLSQDQRPHLLVELANMHDTGYGRFVDMFSVGTPVKLLKGSRRRGPRQFYALTEKQLLQLRNELRVVWHAATHVILYSWLTLSKPADGDLDALLHSIRNVEGASSIGFSEHGPYAPIYPSLALGRFAIDSRNLPLQLVQAVLEHHQNMRVCANPECVRPYFLAKRNHQKYCEAGECTNYAHRQNALKYWRKTHATDTPQSQDHKRKEQRKERSGKNKTNRKQR